MMLYDGILYTGDIADDDIKSILNERLPSAIRRSGLRVQDPDNYQIVGIKRVDEARKDGMTTFICVEILVDGRISTHKYVFRIYPTKQKENGDVQD